MGSETVVWKKDQVIYNFDDQSDFGYLLKEGEVEIQSESNITVGYINEGEVFGEQSVLLGTNRTVTAKASKDCVAIKIPRENLIEEFSKSSVLIKAILRSTYLRLTNLNSTKKTNLQNLFDG